MGTSVTRTHLRRLRRLVEDAEVERGELLDVRRARADGRREDDVRVLKHVALRPRADLAAGFREGPLLGAQRVQLRRHPLRLFGVVTRAAAALLYRPTSFTIPLELFLCGPAAFGELDDLPPPRALALEERGRRLLHPRVQARRRRRGAYPLRRAETNEINLLVRVVQLREALDEVIHRGVRRRAREHPLARSNGGANDLDDHLGLPRPGRALDPHRGRALRQRGAHREPLRVVQAVVDVVVVVVDRRRSRVARRILGVRTLRATPPIPAFQRRERVDVDAAYFFLPPVRVVGDGGGEEPDDAGVRVHRVHRVDVDRGRLLLLRGGGGGRLRAALVPLGGRRERRTSAASEQRANDVQARRVRFGPRARDVPQRLERRELPLVRHRVRDPHQPQHLPGEGLV
eukprot:30990-Pelagococcus_subviridis.AAC.4